MTGKAFSLADMSLSFVTKVNNFCDFRFASQDDVPVPNMSRTNGSPVLQIRKGKRDNSKIISLISP